MSSPVSVQCKVINLGILTTAARDAGYTVETKTNENGIIDELTIDMHCSWGKVYVEMLDDNEAQITCDDIKESLFREKILSRYNMYQIRENWENTGKYVFTDDWLTVHQDGQLEMNCERMVM